MTARTAPHNVPSALPRAALLSRAAHSTANTHCADSAHSQSPHQLHAYRHRVSPVIPYRRPRSTQRQRCAAARSGRHPLPPPGSQPASATAAEPGRVRHAAQARSTPHSTGSPGRLAALLLPPRPGPARPGAHPGTRRAQTSLPPPPSSLGHDRATRAWRAAAPPGFTAVGGRGFCLF